MLVAWRDSLDIAARVGRVQVFRRRLRAYTLRASALRAESLATPEGAASTPSRFLPHAPRSIVLRAPSR
ncbi:MAG TPA: hypothetical protein VF461_04465, partial [Gemmatimonadaceae bacterium]